MKETLSPNKIKKSDSFNGSGKVDLLSCWK